MGCVCSCCGPLQADDLQDSAGRDRRRRHDRHAVAQMTFVEGSPSTTISATSRHNNDHTGRHPSSAPPTRSSSPPPQFPSAAAATAHHPVLTKIAIPWAASTPVTRTDIARRRREFWETADSYGGSPEIWQAIKAAVECDDIALARAILDSVGVLLPGGLLTEAYDERGYRYVVPPYCLADPVNVISEDAGDASSASLTSTPADQHPTHDSSASDDDDDNSAASPECAADPSIGKDAITVRTSSGQDIVLYVSPPRVETIRMVKKMIKAKLKTPSPGPSEQLYIGIFWCGQGPLHDSVRLAQLDLPPMAMLQAMVRIAGAASDSAVAASAKGKSDGSGIGGGSGSGGDSGSGSGGTATTTTNNAATTATNTV